MTKAELSKLMIKSTLVPKSIKDEYRHERHSLQQKAHNSKKGTLTLQEWQEQIALTKLIRQKYR